MFHWVVADHTAFVSLQCTEFVHTITYAVYWTKRYSPLGKIDLSAFFKYHSNACSTYGGLSTARDVCSIPFWWYHESIFSVFSPVQWLSVIAGDFLLPGLWRMSAVPHWSTWSMSALMQDWLSGLQPGSPQQHSDTGRGIIYLLLVGWRERPRATFHSAADLPASQRLMTMDRR